MAASSRSHPRPDELEGSIPSDIVSDIIPGMRASAMLRDARRSAGLSQRELAHRTGVAQPAISRIERGLASPRTDTLDRLLRACGKDAALIDRPGAGVR
jgi:predicted transcriptional regulator